LRRYDFELKEEIVARRSFIETIVYTALKDTMNMDPKERAEVLANVFLEQIETMSLIYPELWEDFLEHVEKQFNKMFKDVLPPIKLNPDLYDFRSQLLKVLTNHWKKICSKGFIKSTADWHEVKKSLNYIINKIIVISAQATLFKFKLLR